MQPLTTGQIVWAEMADANSIRKLRPGVIVTPTDRITSTGPLDVVAITSRLAAPLPEDHILLPWHPQGHPRAGLNRRCAAVCTWLVQLSAGDIQGVAGIVPPSLLSNILAKIAAALPPSSPALPAGGLAQGPSVTPSAGSPPTAQDQGGSTPQDTS